MKIWKHLDIENRKAISSCISHNYKLINISKILNYEHSNGKTININHIYKTLYDIVNYTKDEEEKIKEYAFIYLRVNYGLELNN